MYFGRLITLPPYVPLEPRYSQGGPLDASSPALGWETTEQKSFMSTLDMRLSWGKPHSRGTPYVWFFPASHLANPPCRLGCQSWIMKDFLARKKTRLLKTL